MTEFLLAHLRDETELSMSDLLDEGHATDKAGSARDRQWTFGFKDGVLYFSKFPRQQILIELFQYAIEEDKYSIAYKVLKYFMADLLRTKGMNIIDKLIEKLKDTTRYEAKISLVITAIPLMQQKAAFDLMKVVIEVLDEPASNSFLRNNINPLRVGLMLYRMIA